MKPLNVALVSHIISDDNLGCCALAISNIKILDEVFSSLSIPVHYIIATTDNLEQIDISSFTKNTYEYRIYPRCRQTLRNPLRLIKTQVFKDCDIAFNLCGGDGYTDIYGLGRLMAESQLAWVAKTRKIPMVYAPQTIGPFNTRNGRILAKFTLNKVYEIFVRDHKSYECCKQLRLKKVTEVIDVAFALPYSEYSLESDKSKIGINVSGLLYNGGYNRKNFFGLSFNYSSFINKLLSELVDKKVYEVHLIPHVNSDRNIIDDDYSVCKFLSEKYDCILSPRFSSPIDAKSYISQMDLFCGARMHATIGAISSGVPVIPVAYSRKFNGLYSALEYPWIIDAKSDLTEDDAIEVFFKYLDQIEEMQRNVKHTKGIYERKLEEYKEYLKGIINEFE